MEEQDHNNFLEYMGFEEQEMDEIEEMYFLH